MAAVAEDDADLYDVEVDADTLHSLAKVLDEHIRLLAMAPYIRTSAHTPGAAKSAKEDEQHIQDSVRFVTSLLPGFGLVVDGVWQGQTDADALTQQVLQNAPSGDEVVQQLGAVAVKQLLACNARLQEAYGPPDPQAPPNRQKLVIKVKREAHIQEWVKESQARLQTSL